MDGFHYYNLFETKGFEYILTIVFFLFLIPFWIMLNKKVKITQQIGHALGTLSLKFVTMPRGVYHSPNHSWMHLLRSGKARVGLSDLLLKITGRIRVVPLKAEGEIVKKGEQLLEIRQGEKVMKIAAPLTGEILRYSHADAENLLLDPYGNGWLLEMIPSDWIAETRDYYLADATAGWAEKEIVRFKDFLVNSLSEHEPQLQPATLQDGGELREHILEELPPAIWNDFETKFLPSITVSKEG